MESSKNRDPLIERRSHDSDYQSLWTELTLAQKFSASSLSKYGYELAFIRHSTAGNIAVMLLDDNASTISSDGMIDSSPDIIIR
ncbi:hypothetical protein tinsulaeT_13290 [Thalassotalea insulae]|uniref:RES domain-containing protein n=1 Tax=Thalassotalea insulae TaxID=2056778 RepID=A0ABQ6GRM1_9GAMM|nr:hypothetical protein [Thalassotalea insulae]GLX77989.1 hypothetical protein tinsulaeT_13290 [Thalassotalea insulae]